MDFISHLLKLRMLSAIRCMYILIGIYFLECKKMIKFSYPSIVFLNIVPQLRLLFLCKWQFLKVKSRFFFFFFFLFCVCVCVWGGVREGTGAKYVKFFFCLFVYCCCCFVFCFFGGGWGWRDECKICKCANLLTLALFRFVSWPNSSFDRILFAF